MTFISKTDLSKQAKILPNQIASFEGGISLGNRFFIKNIEIDVDNSISDYVLAYDPLGQKYSPKPIISGAELSSYRIINGMSISGDPNDNLHFYVLPGIYQIDTNFFNFTGNTITLSSGDTTFDRFDVLFVTGGTGSNDIQILEGIPSPNPQIPTVTGQEAIIGIIRVSSGTTSNTGGITIFYPGLIEAFQVLYNRGIYTNLSEFLDANYVRPEIRSFQNNITEAVYGQSFSAITFTWETNKTGYQYLINPTGFTADNNIFQTTFHLVNITGDTGNTQTDYTLTFDDGITNINATTSVNYYNKIYYGAFSSDTITNNQILSLEYNQIIKSNELDTVILSGLSKYIYFCYPQRLGDVSIFVNGMFSTAFTQLFDNVENEFGFIEPYNIIRTDIPINSNKMFFKLFPSN